MFGFPAALIHGDPMVLDRWLWLKARLPEARSGERLLDVGCGSGAFTIGAALRGYEALGLSWDARNQQVARERAALCGAARASFDELDVRKLSERTDLRDVFDVVVCCENIEHIIDDRKLFRDMSACLKPGGRLLLTTPLLTYRPLGPADNGPFIQVEDGGHVRRGYNKAMLKELCSEAGLTPEALSGCSGILSQKLTTMQRRLGSVHPALGWASILPLRAAPPLLDRGVTKLAAWPEYSICLEAYKPRFARGKLSESSVSDSAPKQRDRSRVD